MLPEATAGLIQSLRKLGALFLHKVLIEEYRHQILSNHTWSYWMCWSVKNIPWTQKGKPPFKASSCGKRNGGKIFNNNNFRAPSSAGKGKAVGYIQSHVTFRQCF